MHKEQVLRVHRYRHSGKLKMKEAKEINLMNKKIILDLVFLKSFKLIKKKLSV